jgi:hypothetical protein
VTDLDAIRRCLSDGILGDSPETVSGATVDDVADAATALLAEVDRLRLMERVTDRVRRDLDSQLSEALAEVDRLRAAIEEHRDCPGEVAPERHPQAGELLPCEALHDYGACAEADGRLWAVLERGDDR